MFKPHPKKKRISLKGKAYTQFRKAVYNRAKGCCETCGRWVSLYRANGDFDVYTCGHVSHIKSRGAGGDDSLENCILECFACHRARHDGRL